MDFKTVTTIMPLISKASINNGFKPKMSTDEIARKATEQLKAQGIDAENITLDEINIMIKKALNHE